MPPLAMSYRLYHMPEVFSRSGPVTVKDAHSPGANRNTEVYTVQAWDCTGAHLGHSLLQRRAVLQVCTQYPKP
jgi:hypothetical protein